MNGTALIYCRVSTRKQEDEGTSLDSQARACILHAEELGFRVGRVTQEVHTGTDLWDRPLLARDRADLKSGQFQALVAYSTDRLSRDPIHLAIVAEECERKDVALLFVTEPLDSSPEGALIRYVKGYAAQMEREKIRERNMRGKHQRIHTGNVPRWGYPPYGYRLAEIPDPDRPGHARSVRVIYEPEAAVVRRMFRMAVEEGLGLVAIAKRLNLEQVPSPGTGKRKVNPGNNEGRWGTTQVRRMLKRPEYKGESYGLKLTCKQGRSVPRPQEQQVRLPSDATPAIVSPELWQAVQDQLEHRGAPVRGDRRDSFHLYLLRGLIYCKVCGCPMRSTPDHGRFVYRCSSREPPGGPCGGRPARANDAIPKRLQPRDPVTRRLISADEQARAHLATMPGVDRLVWEAVAEMLREPERIKEEIENLQLKGPDPALKDDLAAAKRGLIKIEQQQQRLVRRFGEDDRFPWELVEREVTRLEEEKTQLRSVVADLERRIGAQAADARQLEQLLDHYQHVRDNVEWHLDNPPPERKRRTLELLRIRVYANGTETPVVWCPFTAIAGSTSPQSR